MVLSHGRDRRALGLIAGWLVACAPAPASQPSLAHSSWALDSGAPASWRQITFDGDPNGPAPRAFHAMAYDEQRGVVVLFGGQSLLGNSTADTWEWDGGSWTLRSDGGPGEPPLRHAHAMAYDPARRKTVLFSGSGAPNDTWELDASGWVRVDAGNSAPSSRYFASMAFDARRRQVLLTGGVPTDGETWAWDGSAWSFLTDGGPPVSGGGMAYDPTRAMTEFYGGQTAGGVDPAVLWTWDESRWTPSPPNQAPGARYRLAFVFDAARGLALLFGGLNAASVAQPGTWEWDGQTWTALTGLSPPAADGPAMAYDCRRAVTVLFGGVTAAGYTNATWEYGVPGDGGDWVPGSCVSVAAFDGGSQDGGSATDSGGAFPDGGPPDGGAGNPAAVANLGCVSGGTAMAWPALLALALASSARGRRRRAKWRPRSRLPTSSSGPRG
jgi:hypothetical protein